MSTEVFEKRIADLDYQVKALQGLIQHQDGKIQCYRAAINDFLELNLNFKIHVFNLDKQIEKLNNEIKAKDNDNEKLKKQILEHIEELNLLRVTKQNLDEAA